MKKSQEAVGGIFCVFIGILAITYAVIHSYKYMIGGPLMLSDPKHGILIGPSAIAAVIAIFATGVFFLVYGVRSIVISQR